MRECRQRQDRKSTRLNSSHLVISYAVFCLKKKKMLGVLRVTRAALPLMPHDSGASISNIGSNAGHTAYEGGAAYCAAKAGEIFFSSVRRPQRTTPFPHASPFE